jgi:SHS2 domain-containing protein
MFGRNKMFETFEHKADMGVRGFGKSVDEAFQEGAKAMFFVECNVKKVKPLEKAKIKASAQNVEELFVEWLNQLLAESSIRNMLFSKFNVKIKDNKLIGYVFGEKIQKKHELKVEVKAATYSQLKVFQNKKKWICQCIVDV